MNTATIIHKHSCRNCAYRHSEGHGMVCRLNPPVPLPSYRPGPDGTLLVVGCVSAFPSVTPDIKCGQHKFLAIYDDVPVRAAPVRVAG